MSLSDKTGAEQFVKTLSDTMGSVHIIASDGTLSYISERLSAESGEIRYTNVSEIIGSNYSASSRVKSLGFELYSAILEPNPNGLCIDVVYCDVYNFAAVAKKAESDIEALVEAIDVGGISLLRAAAKNWQRVLGIATRVQRKRFLDELQKHSDISEKMRLLHASEIFTYTAEYDASISRRLSLIQSSSPQESAKPEETFSTDLQENATLPGSVDIVFRSKDHSKTIQYEEKRFNGKSLRYGDNPEQASRLYVPAQETVSDSNTSSTVMKSMFADMEVVKEGKVCSRSNIIDIDSALGVFSKVGTDNCAVVLKHGNPCGAARAATIEEAVHNAWHADKIASFGGVLVMNEPLMKLGLAEALAEHFFDAIVAPDFDEGVLAIFAKKKNLSLYTLPQLKYSDSEGNRAHVRTLSDGSLLLQEEYKTTGYAEGKWTLAEYTGKRGEISIERAPSAAEILDMEFGWYVQAATMSNSVLFVKDGCTVGIAAGEQDRVGAAQLARNKAYRNAIIRSAFEEYKKDYTVLTESERREIDAGVENSHGNLNGAVMVSDGFFPFRDGVDVGLKEKVGAVLQPGGSIRDHEVIKACNEYGATMMFTHQRGFKH